MAKQQSLRSQQRSFTRARFIDAALEIFEEVGFHDATIDMITKRAGANRSTFYLHFKDKTDLMLAADERITPSGEETFAMLNEVEEPTYKQFRAWIEQLASNWEQHHKIYEAIMQAQLTNPSVAKNNYRILSGILEPYLSRFKGKKRAAASHRLEMFCMQFEMYFFTTICECAEAPSSAALDALAELGYFALYGKDRN
ncbi:MAG: TetR/AcrR family transcriptional regulator [Pseudomonadota bacterium]